MEYGRESVSKSSDMDIFLSNNYKMFTSMY